MSGVNSSVNSIIKLGAYAGRLANLNLAGNINPSSNLTTVYLDTSILGPIPDPLDYVPSPGCIRQPSGYPLNSVGGRLCTGGSTRRHPPPPPPYSTHQRMNLPTGRAQPRRVLQATVQVQNSKILAPRGESLAKLCPQGLERPNPPCTLTSTRGRGGREVAGILNKPTTIPEHFTNLATRGEPLAKFWPQGSERPNPPHAPLQEQGGRRGTIGAASERAMRKETSENLVNRVEPLAKFWSPGTGGGGHMPHPHPPP